MNLSYSKIMLILFIFFCASALRYLYIGYMKGPRMIKKWKEIGNVDAVNKWEKYIKQCKRWSAPLSMGLGLVCLLGYGLDQASIYLHSLHIGSP